MIRRIGVGLAVALTLSLLAVVPAQADPPPPDPPCPEPIGGWCVGEIPYTVFENPQPPPIPQQDTGNSGTGALAEGEDATSYPCYGLVQFENSIPASGGGQWTVQWRTCVEDLPGADWRSKYRVTFFYDGPGGRSTAYGNVRWDVKWTTPQGPPTRRLWRYDDAAGVWGIMGYTSSRPDAIQVHSTVAYSQVGCTQSPGYWVRSTYRKHYVRMPNGTLYGPFGKDSLSTHHTSACGI